MTQSTVGTFSASLYPLKAVQWATLAIVPTFTTASSMWGKTLLCGNAHVNHIAQFDEALVTD